MTAPLEAGPALDRAVAEALGGARMGGFCCPRCESTHFGTTADGLRHCHGEFCFWSGPADEAPPPYSTDPAAAFAALTAWVIRAPTGKQRSWVIRAPTPWAPWYRVILSEHTQGNPLWVEVLDEHANRVPDATASTWSTVSDDAIAAEWMLAACRALVAAKGGA